MSPRERWENLKRKDPGLPSFHALFPGNPNAELYFNNVLIKSPQINNILTQLEEHYANEIAAQQRRELAEREREGWLKVRELRNNMLLKTDWTQVTDAPLTSKQRLLYREYRQYLRDVPKLFSRYDEVKIMSFDEFLKHKV